MKVIRRQKIPRPVRRLEIAAHDPPTRRGWDRERLRGEVEAEFRRHGRVIREEVRR